MLTCLSASDSLDKRDPLPAKEYMYKLASESVERKNTDDILDKRAKEYMYKLNAETTEPVDDSLDKREPLPGKEYMYKLASEKAEELLDEQ